MDDTIRNVAIGLGAFLAIHIALGARAHHAAVKQVSQSFDNAGPVHVDLRASGPFGLELNDFASVDIEGEHVRSGRLPFYIFPKPGWKGSIHHLRLNLTDYMLAGLPVRLFTADLPHVSYDIGHAFYRGRLVLRGAGSGPAWVHVAPEGLRVFIVKKFQKTLSDVNVRIIDKKLYIDGRVQLLGPPTAFTATGVLSSRGGRYIDLVESDLTLNDKPVSPAIAQSIVKQINPVLDIYQDLGLEGFFDMTGVGIGDLEVVIDGVATLPTAPPGTAAP